MSVIALYLAFIYGNMCAVSLKCQGQEKNKIVCCTGYFWNTETNICQKCTMGFYGVNCSERCPYPSFGEDCQSECKCPSSLCHFAFGCTTATEDFSKKMENGLQTNYATLSFNADQEYSVNKTENMKTDSHQTTETTKTEEKSYILLVLCGLIGIFGTLFFVFFTMFVKNKYCRRNSSRQHTTDVSKIRKSSWFGESNAVDATNGKDFPPQPNDTYENIEADRVNSENLENCLTNDKNDKNKSASDENLYLSPL